MAFTIHIDRESCIGAGTCETLAPELFAVLQTGTAAVLTDDPDEGLRDAAEAAESSCPMAAVSLLDRG